MRDLSPGDLLRPIGRPVLWASVGQDWRNLGFIEPGSVMLLVATDKADYVLVVCDHRAGYVRHGWIERLP